MVSRTRAALMAILDGCRSWAFGVGLLRRSAVAPLRHNYRPVILG